MITILQKYIASGDGPKYRRIVEAIRAALAAGEVGGGEQLPPQRELADALGVTLGTVTRAYREIDRLGLARGEVGRGTFLTRPEGSDFTLQVLHNRGHRADGGTVRFDLNYPVPEGDPDLAAMLAELGRTSGLGTLLGYQQTAGLLNQRRAACRWLRQFGMVAEPERLALTTGAQHALCCVLAGRLLPGEGLAVDPHTYPGIINLAKMLRLRLVAVEGDEEGMRPDLLEKATATQRLKGVYLIPTLHNPTTRTMPEGRRRQLAEVIRRQDLFLLEDDVYGSMAAVSLSPLALLVPERTFYVSNLSKTLAPGLRIGFLVAPQSEMAVVEETMAATIWVNPPLVGEIARRWLEDGTAWATLQKKRHTAIHRMDLLGSTLRTESLLAPPGSLHAWLILPPPWTGESFAREALRRGVQLVPSESFFTGVHEEKRAVRICIGPPKNDAEILRGAAILAELLSKPGRGGALIM